MPLAREVGKTILLIQEWFLRRERIGWPYFPDPFYWGKRSLWKPDTSAGISIPERDLLFFCSVAYIDYTILTKRFVAFALVNREASALHWRCP